MIVDGFCFTLDMAAQALFKMVFQKQNGALENFYDLL